MTSSPAATGAARPGAARVSVVIATRNRSAELCRTLARLTVLPERPHLVVVDNASQDGTPALVRRRFPGTDVITLRRNRGAWARNLGVACSPTPYVALSDDDSWWEPGALATAASVLDDHPRAGLLAARTLVGPAAVPDPANALMEASPLDRDGLPGPAVLGFLGCAAVVRRAAFTSAGGFSRLLVIGGEEQLLAYDMAAAGWPACYVRDIVALHHPSKLRDDVVRRYLCARNQVLVAWMRRPAHRAAEVTADLGRRARHEPVAARALAGAVARLPAALAQRRALPPHVEAAAALLGH